jgi:hypothetical protein
MTHGLQSGRRVVAEREPGLAGRLVPQLLIAINSIVKK